MKLVGTIVAGWMLALATIMPSQAQTNGAISVHEIAQGAAPQASLEIQKDATGGFNV